MSRWIQQFEEHPFRTPWNQIIELKDKITVEDQSVSTNVQEVARLIKVITYLEGLLDSCDPELVPVTTWDNFLSQCNACLQQIKSYQSNRNIGHINNANSHADNLLNYVRPYIVPSGKAAKSASASFTHYSKTISKHLESFNDQSSSILSNLNDLHSQASSSNSEIEAMKQRIEDFNTKVLIGDEEESYSNQFDNLLNAMEKMHEKAVNYHNELNVGSEEAESIVKLVENARANIIEKDLEMEQKKTESTKRLEELKSFYRDVFGTFNKDSEEYEGGLKQEVEGRITQLDLYDTTQKTKFATINQEIEHLLNGATSAGLASSYQKLKESYFWPIIGYSVAFYTSIIVLFLVALFTVSDSISWTSITFTSVEDLSKFLSNLILKLPVVLPVLWLTLFVSKRRSELVRLRQEYAHKEAMATSYLNFKKQIKELDSTEPELMKKLLESTIETVAYNASLTLDKKHGDNMPVQEIIEKTIAKAKSSSPATAF